MSKRAELTFSKLALNRVKISLYDVVKTTGELKDVFRFTYNGRRYDRLSLSEKIRAGAEVSELVKRLTGRNYPVFFDNMESVDDLSNIRPTSQMILAKCVHNAELSVRAGGQTMPRRRNLTLRKGKGARRLAYQKLPILEAARRCGLVLSDRTLHSEEVEANCPFCGDHGTGKYHLSLNTRTDQYRCNLCGASGQQRDAVCAAERSNPTKKPIWSWLQRATCTSCPCSPSSPNTN